MHHFRQFRHYKAEVYSRGIQPLKGSIKFNKNFIEPFKAYIDLNTNPYRTPIVIQNWAIVNASLPCNIFYSISRLKLDSLKRILTAQTRNFQQSKWQKKERERLWSGRLRVQSPYGTLFSQFAQVCTL